ncbi:MAG: PilN domain-containing protein [Thiotrichales bacterium]|nr:PilN domain-containing protein [Thiotrichales bacterium]
MQQINLYQDQFRKQKKLLSAGMLFLLPGLAVVALATIQTVNNQSRESLQQEQQRLAAEIEGLTTKVAIAEQAAKPKPVDKLLEKEVQGLVSRLQHNQRLLKALTEGAMSNTEGFSQYFEAIANRHVDGTWITGMQIGQGGIQFAFSGKSITPDLVPVYLENLSDEDVFNNFSFNVLEIERDKEDSAVIDFNVATGNG